MKLKRDTLPRRPERPTRPAELVSKCQPDPVSYAGSGGSSSSNGALEIHDTNNSIHFMKADRDRLPPPFMT